MRYLRIYKKYKFRLVTDLLWIGVNIATFTFMGAVIEPKAGAISYSFTSFFMVGVLFWTALEASYINSVTTITEEASSGTLGILYTNGVSPLKLIISRMISSTFIFGTVAIFVVFPLIHFMGMIDIFSVSLINLALLLPVMAASWFFMLSMSITFGSLALLVKKLGGTAGVVVQGLKILSGYFFPIVGFPSFLQKFVSKLPITIALEMTRNILILNTVKDLLDNLFWLFSGTLFFLLLSYAFYTSAERRARLKGTIEVY